MTPPVIQEVANAIDHAAAASDRWLFLAAIVIIIGGCIYIIRHLVKAQEGQQKTHNDFTTTLYKENVTLIANMLVVMAETNELLKRLAPLLTHCEAFVREEHEARRHHRTHD